MAEPLTDAEHETLWILEVLLKGLRDQIISHGPQREQDLREAVIHIHALQHMVMAQAAARAYPERYRALGGSVEEA